MKHFSIRRAIMMVSLIIMASLSHSQAAFADSNTVDPKDVYVDSPLIENTQKLQEVTMIHEVKQEEVEKKANTVEDVKKQVETVVETKKSLQQEVDSMRAEVEAMKAKVAQKQAAEAEQATIAAQVQQTQVETPQNGSTTAYTPSYTPSYSYDSSGNTYEAGQCTWYVKNRRPDLPNSLGNASDWYWNAQALGLPTGLEPAVGAAASRKYGNHVVYVEAVNGDGTITVSEMNYDYVPFDTRTTTKNASDYYYIY